VPAGSAAVAACRLNSLTMQAVANKVRLLTKQCSALTGEKPDGNRSKGGDENIKIAFHEMERICTFDPLVVLRGRHDSVMADHRGKTASYLISIRERLNDAAQSIRR